jgi:segregation and condensation protein A
MYKVSLENFEGPLDLLLQLIEKEELDITQISLAKVTDTFLSYLEKIEEIKPDELADFLVVAAKLLLIKSSLLLPSMISSEEEVTDLVDQLKIYREFLLASKNIQKMINRKNFSYSREKFPSGLVQRNFRLTTKITTSMLKNIFENILQVIISQIKLAQSKIEKVISLKEKIADLINFLNKFAEVKFSQIVTKSTKAEIVVTFLAILELVKEKTITIYQDGLFEDITIKKIT